MLIARNWIWNVKSICDVNIFTTIYVKMINAAFVHNNGILN